MINVKDQVYGALKDICENVSDGFPSDWETLPAIAYVEEENSVYEWTDGKEDKSKLRYKIDIFNTASTSALAIEVDKSRLLLMLRKKIQFMNGRMEKKINLNYAIRLTSLIQQALRR